MRMGPWIEDFLRGMEADAPAAALEIPVSGNPVDEETALLKSNELQGGVRDSVKVSKVHLIASMERSSMENNSVDSSDQKNQEDQIKSTKDEVGEVREENERLKLVLAQIRKEYQSLQIQFCEIVQNEEAKKFTDVIVRDHHQEEEETDDLVSLSLGRASSTDSKKDDKKTSFLSGKQKEDEKIRDEGLTLGLDCRFEPALTEPMMNTSHENSSEEPKDEEPSTETWPPSKILKMGRSREDEALEQPPLKKARVSVRARCNTPTMNDGCQWRKYGQKIAKGNPCPRAYYRCTVSPSCPVRKQVQRCAEDLSILVTTYEGTHNHPLPAAATAMASTTSAAASMLRSGSSSSTPGLDAFAASSSSTANLHGLNFAIPQNSRSHQQFYFPTSSFSTSNSHPTITLDLTAPTASQFNRLSSSFPSAPRHPATCLNFSSSSSSSSPLDPGGLPASWGSIPGYGALSSYNKNQIGPFNFGRQPENVYQPYMQKINNQAPSQSLTESIATATKAITADPIFRSALAAAITSFVSNAGAAGGGQENHVKGENPSSRDVKWGEFLSTKSPLPSSHNGAGCASTYLNRATSANSQQGNSNLFPPLFPFSVPKTASASPSDHKDNIK